MVSFSERRSRVWLAAASAALILLLAVVQFTQFRADQRLRQRIDTSYAVQAQLLRLLSLQQDIETGQRGYVLTGEPEFLEPYSAARAQIGPLFSQLRQAAADDPRMRSTLDELSRLSSQKLAFSERVIALQRQGASEAAADLIATGQGKAVMDATRDRVGQLIRSDRHELSLLTSDKATSRLRVQLISITIQLLLLGMLAAAVIAYLGNLRRLRAASAKTQDYSARQAAIFEAAQDAMLVLNRKGDIESMNPAAERLFGRTPAELHGRSVVELFAERPQDESVKSLLTSIARSAEATGSTLQEFVGRRADGTTFEGDVAISAVRLADDLRYFIAIRDASERRRVERMKTEFVSTVSHELRTPLTSIAGSLGLVAAGAAGPIEARAAKLISIAHSNSQRLVRLINDILDIEKIESGKMAFDLKPLPLRAVLQESIQANLGYAADAGVEIALEAGGSEALVTSDRDRLIQVITNLLSNAIKFSRPATAVRVRITPGTTTHRFTVSDCGPGIPNEFRDRIFGKFAQADSSDTRSKGGTGLGLAIVKEIVDRSGGKIDFETSPSGTSFHVDLPAARGETLARSVLLVQIDPGLSRTIEKSLSQRGIQVDVVGNKAELAAAAEQRDYGAILLGIGTAGEKTSEFVRLIRSHGRLATTPILASAPATETDGASPALALVDWLNRAPSAVDLERGASLLPSSHKKDGSQLCVLHVEDDDDVRRVVATAFDGKARLIAAGDAQEARAALQTAAPDLVILDLALPGESGLELLSDLRRGDGELIPVVIYTASDEDTALASRVAAMLTKSKAGLDQLVETVLRVVNEQPGDSR